MKNLLSRMSMAALLAASCFFVVGCDGGDKPAPAPAEPASATAGEAGSDTATEKADGSAKKEEASAGSEKK